MPTGCDGGAATAVPPGAGPSSCPDNSPGRNVDPAAGPSQPLSPHTETSGSYVTDDGDTDGGLSDDGADSGQSGGAGLGPGSSAAPGSGDKGRRGRSGAGGGSRSTARGVGNNKPPVSGVPPVLLLLAGLPGSGKSTFSRSLQEASAVSWVHVNQDAISKGKPGKREQCVAAVRAALAEGSCCIIDRCHLDASQRVTFLQLAAECRVAAHCVALTMPAKECAGRVAARTDHPGGVQGDRNKGVVYRMAKQQQDGKGWPPTAAEGFVSVMDCLTDSDASAAVRAWAAYGAAPAAGGGTVATAPAAAAAAGGSAAHAKPDGAPQSTAAAQAAPTLAMWQTYVAKRKVPAAAPSITAFFKPAAAKAGAAGNAPAAAGAAAGSGPKAPAASGTQVGAARSAPVAGGKAAAGAATAGSRPRSAEASPPEQRPAKRPATVQPSAGASPQGAATSTGTAVKSSGSPVSGRAAMSSAAPASEQSQGNGSGGASGAGATAPGIGGGANAFALLMKGSRQAAAAAAGAKPSPAGAAARAAAGGGGVDTDRRFKLDSPWAQALRKTAQDPDSSQQQVLYKDAQVVMIMDAFPKARSHALVIARNPALRSIADLRAEHVPLLEHMRHVTQDWIAKRREQVPGTAAFKLGFHAVPSMCQLHLHVISQDFDSPALKNKKHWNTFTTEFFLPLDQVLGELASQGRVTLISEAEEKRLEGKELSCHACGKLEKNIPALKSHIVACDAVKRLPGL
ncbi:hypothetical protein HXX76_011307 [Chlamydomonas incerta]|uniref:HIT domain-containing protein n=1 Tax=Chlamydomonas incerta TaxID=51695 RepID=A0A835SKY2_CHLIN|nr:hypothetical protein HXX76_011307 [Chlamydomonas incerta]|eukprot:KAG2429067.1 hypothetical protein HXX76_011307 [Chlamydomonas incerta]